MPIVKKSKQTVSRKGTKQTVTDLYVSLVEEFEKHGLFKDEDPDQYSEFSLFEMKIAKIFINGVVLHVFILEPQSSAYTRYVFNENVTYRIDDSVGNNTICYKRRDLAIRAIRVDLVCVLRAMQEELDTVTRKAERKTRKNTRWIKVR